MKKYEIEKIAKERNIDIKNYSMIITNKKEATRFIKEFVELKQNFLEVEHIDDEPIWESTFRYIFLDEYIIKDILKQQEEKHWQKSRNNAIKEIKEEIKNIFDTAVFERQTIGDHDGSKDFYELLNQRHIQDNLVFWNIDIEDMNQFCKDLSKQKKYDLVFWD